MKPLVRKSIFLWILLVCFSHCVTSLEILKNRSESGSDSGSDEDSGQETLAVAEKLIQQLDDISHRLDDDNQYIGDAESIRSDDIDHLEDIFRMVGRSINSSEGNYEDIDEDFIRTKLTRKHVEELKRELRQVFFDPQFQERQGGSRPRQSLRLRPFGFLTRQRARQPPSDFLRPPSGNNRNNNRPNNNNNNNIGPQPGNPIFSGPVQVPQSSAPVPGFANNNFNPGNNINNNNFVRQQPPNDNRQSPGFRFPPNANLQQQQPLLPPPPPVQQQQQQQLLQQQQQQQQQRLRNPQFNNGPVQNPAFLPPQQQQPPPPFIPSQPESPDNFRPVVNQQQLPPQQQQQGPGSLRNVQQPILSVPLQNFGQLNNFDVSGPPTAPGNSLSIPNNRPNLPANINLINNNNINKNPIRNNNLNCEQFTEEICLDVRNYPGDVILNALTRNKPVVEAMLAEARSQSADDLIDGVSAAQERKYTYSHYYGNRRQGDDAHVHRDFASEGGFLCPSDVRYAKPRLAQNNRGVWKYIVNVAEYTQTLRMERCLKPDSSCSYVSPHYKSHCTQLFNYHRLLSWEQQRGLHVDIYKIPTACTCHIQGYAFLYPPLDGKTHGVLPPAFNTDNNNNTIPSTRRTDNNNPFNPPRNFGFSRSSGPGARKSDFDSFMEQHEIGSLSNSWNRRSDLVADDNQDEPWETSATQQVPNRKKKLDKINYSYHPITDYFLPKSNRPTSDRKRY